MIGEPFRVWIWEHFGVTIRKHFGVMILEDDDQNDDELFLFYG